MLHLEDFSLARLDELFEMSTHFLWPLLEDEIEEVYCTDEKDDDEESPSPRKEDTQTTDPHSAAAKASDSVSRQEKARLEQKYDGGRAVGEAAEDGTSTAERQTSSTGPRLGAAQSRSGGAEAELRAAEIGMPTAEEVNLE